MYAELIYTRCGSGVDILKNMATVGTSGFKVYSCSRSVVENGDLDLNLLLAVCQRKAAFEDPDVMDDAYSFEVTENGHKILSCFHPLPFNPNASGNYANRPGNFINQVIISSFEGLYPYETFGCKNLWTARDYPEEYFYVNKPEILPERKVSTGNPVITDETIRNFINEGRTELLKQAVCFIIEQFESKNNRQKFLVIKDKSNLEIQFWIAAIESAFSPAVASSIPFAMCMARFESCNRYGVKNGKFVPDINLKDPEQHQRLHAMIVGLDSRLWPSSVLTSPDYIVLDAINGTIDYQGDVSESYYALIADHNKKKIRFVRNFLQYLDVMKPCSEILRLADFYISLEDDIKYLESFRDRIKFPSELILSCIGNSEPLPENSGHIFEDGNIEKINGEFDFSRLANFIKGFEKIVKFYNRNQNSKAASYIDELLYFVQSICLMIRVISPTEGEKLTQLTLASLSAAGKAESAQKLKSDIQSLNNYLEKRKRDKIEKILLKGIRTSEYADIASNSRNVSDQQGYDSAGSSILKTSLIDDVTDFPKQPDDTNVWIKGAVDNLFSYVTGTNSDSVTFSFAELYKIIESAFVRKFGRSSQPFSILFQNVIVSCIKSNYVNKDINFAFFMNKSISDELDISAVIAEIDRKLDIGKMLASNQDNKHLYIRDALELMKLNQKGIYLHNSLHILLLCDNSTGIPDDMLSRIVHYDLPDENNDLYIKKFISEWLDRSSNSVCDDKLSEQILNRKKYLDVVLDIIFSNPDLYHEKLKQLLKNALDYDSNDLIRTIARKISSSENKRNIEKNLKRLISKKLAKKIIDDIKEISCDYPENKISFLKRKICVFTTNLTTNLKRISEYITKAIWKRKK